MAFPPQSGLRQFDTHRLIPTRYDASDQNVLIRIVDLQELDDVLTIDTMTNDRVLAENGLLPGIGIHELVFNIPFYHVINAAFTHPHPLGGRFNSPARGAWYAGCDIVTAQDEVAHHRTIALQEVDYFYDDAIYVDYLADFSAPFHDLRDAPQFADCLDPQSYVASQKLAERLLEKDAVGVVYPSVRSPAGTCIACFRPAIVTNVRKDRRYQFTWSGSPASRVTSL